MRNRDTRSPERALALRVVKAWLRLWRVCKADDPSVPRRWADGKLHKKVGDAWVIVSEMETDEKPNMFGEKNDSVDSNSPVKHEGEYVLTKTGKKDFGEIKSDTGLEPGKIRLREGKQNEEKGDYGEKHIERPDRLAQLKNEWF